jgi:hypothetical protein
VNVEIENRGHATTGEIKAFLRHPDSESIELIDGSASLTELAPAERASLDLSVRGLKSFTETPELDLILTEEKFRIVIESKIRLAAGKAEANWLEPPSLAIERIEETTRGIRLVARVEDDAGIATAWASADGEQAGYLDVSTSMPKKLYIRIPWSPGREVKTISIQAVDTDGLTSRLFTEL